MVKQGKRALKIVKSFLALLGDNVEREGLQETPRRVLAAWKEWAAGYDKDPQDVMKTFRDGSESYDEVVFVGSIPLYSTCMHHLAPFFGVAHVAYIPNGKIIGLSKIPRLVEIYARRLTVQEKITTEVAEALQKYLQPRAVGVTLRCRHLCLESRGVQKPGTITTTTALLGAFKEESSARAEFLQYVKMSDEKSTI